MQLANPKFKIGLNSSILWKRRKKKKPFPAQIPYHLPTSVSSTHSHDATIPLLISSFSARSLFLTLSQTPYSILESQAPNMKPKIPKFPASSQSAPSSSLHLLPSSSSSRTQKPKPTNAIS
jgi:hypothetical protein